ncbi:hypothetical protein RhiirA4_427260 [Rhizophagus irregularis]|uniref:Uncharacterized protein n=1 Tax=Rhizophagus irregularis TaxID=588596 RepID=A0A2I1H899_9GLOM|nr:hypothetical protein RhiirA4_427260 [Rhizophagus irregularis]
MSQNIVSMQKEIITNSRTSFIGVLGRSNDFISHEREEKVHNLENEVTNKERIVLGKNEEIDKYKEIITNLENRVRELEVDVTEYFFGMFGLTSCEISSKFCWQAFKKLKNNNEETDGRIITIYKSVMEDDLGT